MYSGVVYLFYLTCILTFLTYPRSWVLFTHINSHTVHYNLLSGTGNCWYIKPKMVISLMVLHRISQSGSKQPHEHDLTKDYQKPSIHSSFSEIKQC